MQQETLEQKCDTLIAKITSKERDLQYVEQKVAETLEIVETAV
jgi:hypothetical protein